MEKKLYVIFYLSLFFSLGIQTHQEVIYPVAQLDDNLLMMIHQKSYDDLELLLWDRHEGVAIRELTSMFIPSCIQLLPSKKAFSFIDRGRIRIKAFNKRAPRAIDIYEPIYAISSMQWITDEQFYFTGKNYDKLSIFLCDLSSRGAAIFSLTNYDNFDYMYPCKIDENLFCISRDLLKNYAIQKINWAPQIYDKRELVSSSISQQILINHDKPLCFLHMEDAKTGFVLDCVEQELSAKLLSFSCYAFQYVDMVWRLTKLFEFTIPSKFLVGTDEDRMYETIAPFLPRYSQDWIYFVSYDDLSENCTIQRYNRVSSFIEELTDTSRSVADLSHVFAPMIVKDTIYCGFTFSEKTPSAFRGYFANSFLNENEVTGIIQCKLPTIPLQAIDRTYDQLG